MTNVCGGGGGGGGVCVCVCVFAMSNIAVRYHRFRDGYV